MALLYMFLAAMHVSQCIICNLHLQICISLRHVCVQFHGLYMARNQLEMHSHMTGADSEMDRGSKAAAGNIAVLRRMSEHD